MRCSYIRGDHSKTGIACTPGIACATGVVCTLGLLLMCLVGCAGPSANQTVAPEGTVASKRAVAPTPIITIDLDEGRLNRHAFHHYINGNIFEELSDFRAAATSYRKALEYYRESDQIRYCLADVLVRMQQCNVALDILGEMQTLDALAHMLRGDCYRLTGHADSARGAYLDAVLADSLNLAPYGYLVNLYARAGDLDSTDWAYRNMARLNPGNPGIWRELGRLRVQMQAYDSAKVFFRRSVELSREPSNIMSLVGLAGLYHHLGDNDSAVCYYRLAAEIDSTNDLLYRELTDILVIMDSLRAALDPAWHVVELNPSNKGDVRRLAVLYYSMDSLRQADSLLQACVAGGEEHTANHFYLGRIAVAREDFKRARDEFLKVSLMADSVAQSWLDLGFVYRRMGEDSLEIEAYLGGLRHMQDERGRLRLQFALGATYEQSNRFEQAVSTFESVIEADSTHAEALNYLGYMLADRGERLDYAFELIRMAVDLVPDNAAFLDSFGWVYYRLGDFEKAVRHLSDAVKLDSDPVMFDHLGDAYESSGNLEEARKWWQKALELNPEDSTIQDKLR